MAAKKKKTPLSDAPAVEASAPKRMPTPAELREARRAAILSHPDVQKYGGWADKTVAAIRYEGIDSLDNSDRAEVEAILLKREEGNRKLTSAEITYLHKYAVRFGTLSM